MAKVMFSSFDGDVLNRAERSIAHGALTNSKRPQCLVKGFYPTHLVKGQGAFVWDTKGNKFIDFICGLGSNILGYAHEEVNQAIIDRAKKGATLSLGSVIEIEMAEKIKEFFPWVDQVRFLKTGSEACSAAIRIARAKTGYDMVDSQHYHGWHDEFTGLTPPALGVPKRLDIISSDSPQGGHAALIIEPVTTDYSHARFEKLREYRKRCDETKTCLIFDEVITGFRTPKYSVSSASGIEPDLIVLGKAIANGMPLSVVAGKKAVMECGEYFVSSTFAGETLSLAAGLKTLSLLQTKYRIDYLWERGQDFLDRFNSIWPDGISIDGYPTRGVFVGETETKAKFWQEACRAGLLFGPSWFFNFAHIEHTQEVLKACQDICLRIRTGSVKLEGELPVTPFAQKARQA